MNFTLFVLLTTSVGCGSDGNSGKSLEDETPRYGSFWITERAKLDSCAPNRDQHFAFIADESTIYECVADSKEWVAVKSVSSEKFLISKKTELPKCDPSRAQFFAVVDGINYYQFVECDGDKQRWVKTEIQLPTLN
jgi:hypothetical protein